MQAIAFSKPGSPDVLSLQTFPQPQICQPDHVLVRLQAAGVNPVDTKIRQRGSMFDDPLPAILGCDGAGIIEAIGTGVTQFQPGDAVYYCYGGLGKTGTGNYAPYAVVPEHVLAPKPQTLSFTEAAAAPLVLITAWEALRDRARLEPGQTILIQAGTGGVGHVAIQLAKLWGAKVCATVSTPDKARLARQLGADETILYPKADVISAVQEWTDGQGVDVAFDTVGEATFFETVSAVRYGGTLVTLLEPQLAHGSLKLARQRNLRIGLELMLTPQLQNLATMQHQQAQILHQCSQWFDSGQLRIHLAQTFPLAEAAAAHRIIETGSGIGKVALTIRAD